MLIDLSSCFLGIFPWKYTENRVLRLKVKGKEEYFYGSEKFTAILTDRLNQ
jgi:hypothetical protein